MAGPTLHRSTRSLSSMLFRRSLMVAIPVATVAGLTFAAFAAVREHQSASWPFSPLPSRPFCLSTGSPPCEGIPTQRALAIAARRARR